MRNESQKLKDRLDALIASDERTASTIMNLISWADALARAFEEQRQENHRTVDRTADILNGELETLRKELRGIADKLTGEKSPETYGADLDAARLENQRLEREASAFEYGAKCRSEDKPRKAPDGLAQELHKAFRKGWDSKDHDINHNVTAFPGAASA